MIPAFDMVIFPQNPSTENGQIQAAVAFLAWLPTLPHPLPLNCRHDGPKLFNLPPANVTIPGQEGNMTVYVVPAAPLIV